MDDLTAIAAVAGSPPVTTAGRVAEVYDLHQRELFSFGLRCARDREIAEDLVHEAFVRLIVEIDAGREPDNVRAWLFRVTANLNISRTRRDSVAQKQAGELARQGEDAGPEPLYLKNERRSDLEAALADMSPDARTALLMAASGFSGMEIAEAIGRTALATRAMMSRARLQLRERFGSYEAMS